MIEEFLNSETVTTIGVIAAALFFGVPFVKMISSGLIKLFRHILKSKN